MICKGMIPGMGWEGGGVSGTRGTLLRSPNPGPFPDQILLISQPYLRLSKNCDSFSDYSCLTTILDKREKPHRYVHNFYKSREKKFMFFFHFWGLLFLWSV